MRHQSQAFTRVELLALIVVLSFLGTFALPLLATTQRDSDRASCASNFRQMGRAVLLWAADHQERVSWRTPVSEGGTQFRDPTGVAWVEWAVLSNELVTPRILACPADTGVRVAGTFDNTQTGFFNTSMRANALSYIVGLHAYLEYPNSLVSADRNIRSDAYPVGCSIGLNNTDHVTSATTGWTNTVHGNAGHILLVDGHVELTNDEKLRALLSLPSSDTVPTKHFLRAR